MDTITIGPPPPAVEIMRNLGLEPDPWQIDVLEGQHRRLLLNCCRQAGKSTAVALLAIAEAVFVPGTRILLLSRSARQSSELLRRVVDFHRRMGAPLLERRTATELELSNLSRVVSLPCREDTIRGYDNVHLLIIDEAARVPDALYRAVRPMLAVSNGRLICLSTPFGKHGFFYHAWANGGDEWRRIAIRAEEIPRITPEFLAEELRTLGQTYFNQEYCCSFESVQGLVYPDFARCVVEELPSPLLGEGPAVRGERVGGIDFGFRNPFAAVWGIRDKEGVLWLTGEHYARQQPLSFHAAHLPRTDICWHADPAGATERAELICGGFKVLPGVNDLHPGIAAVTGRLNNGTLRVLRGRCPNLLAEAELYRYGSDDEARPETPVDEHNHALAALRYLVMGIDRHRLARLPPTATQEEEPKPARKPNIYYDPEYAYLWRHVCTIDTSGRW